MAIATPDFNARMRGSGDPSRSIDRPTRSITTGSSIAAMIYSSPPHCGARSGRHFAHGIIQEAFRRQGLLAIRLSTSRSGKVDKCLKGAQTAARDRQKKWQTS
jgi:hypothetical protein